MKRVGNLYNQITLKDVKEIYDKQVKPNTKNKNKLAKFEQFYTVNLYDVYEKIKNKVFTFQKYNLFLIKEPKYRIIMSQNIKDKLFNHVVANKILIPVLDKCLIDTNVATRKNKGTHYGIKKLKKYLLEMNDREVYALKFDISKFFYNIDHDVLKNFLKHKIKDKVALCALNYIIDSTDAKYVNLEIKKIKEREIDKIKKSNINNKEKLIEEINKIPYYQKGKGLPIGNMTSQIMAIFYLNELDHFIKEKLKVKYIRYMDDGIILCHDKEYLKKCLNEIKKQLEKCKLNLNNKTQIISFNKGVPFLGFIFYIKNKKIIVKVKQQTKIRFQRKMSKIIKTEINFKSIQVINSYKGHFRYGNCYSLFWRKINNYLYINTSY